VGHAKNEGEALEHMAVWFKRSRSISHNSRTTWVDRKVEALKTVEPVESVLELGVGDLAIMEAWSSFDAVRYTGVDGCVPVIDNARARYPDREFILSPFSGLLEPSPAMPQARDHDLVLALDILYHIPEQAVHDGILSWIFGARKAVLLTYALEVRDYGGKKPGQAGFAWFPRPEVAEYLQRLEGWEQVFSADSSSGEGAPPQRLVALLRRP
jgi:hypothetical protein